jgi:hypothetical protein
MEASDYRLFRDNLWSFLFDKLLRSSFLEEDAISEEHDDFEESKINCICCGLRIYAYIVAAEIEAYHISSDYEWLGVYTKGSLESEKLVQALFQCLDSNGTSVLDIDNIADSNDRVMLEETAALIIFELLKLPAINKRLSIPQWQRLGWTLLHDHADVRQRLMEACCIVLQTHNIPPQYLAYLCLLADDEALKVRAESVLLFAVKRLRVTYDELCSNAVVEGSEELRQLAEEHIPEILLAYVMHLLSYHPDFPSSSTIDSDEDKRRMGHVVKSLKMVLRVLIDSNEKNENLSYLIKQVNVIDQRYEDSHDPDNIGIGFVARTALKLLKERIRTAENVQVFPGDIYLPRGLYRLKDSILMAAAQESKRGGALPLVSPSQMDNLLESDQAIDKELHRLGKTIGKSSKVLAAKHSSPSRSRESTPKLASKSKPKALARAKPSALAKLEEEGSESEESNDELSTRKLMKKALSKVKAKDELDLEIGARRSNRIKTNPHDAKDYREAEDDEEELEEWERGMADREILRSRTSASSSTAAPAIASAAVKSKARAPSKAKQPLQPVAEEADEQGSQSDDSLVLPISKLPKAATPEASSKGKGKGKAVSIPAGQSDASSDDMFEEEHTVQFAVQKANRPKPKIADMPAKATTAGKKRVSMLLVYISITMVTALDLPLTFVAAAEQDRQ